MKNTLRGLAAILFALVLSACGGGGDASIAAAPGELGSPARIIDKPLPGYNADGTIAPATEAPGTPETAAPQPKPCKVPQASPEGIEHGHPPVGRCE